MVEASIVGGHSRGGDGRWGLTLPGTGHVSERARRSHGTLFHCAMIVHCDGMRLKGAGLVLFLGLMMG